MAREKIGQQTDNGQLKIEGIFRSHCFYDHAEHNRQDTHDHPGPRAKPKGSQIKGLGYSRVLHIIF